MLRIIEINDRKGLKKFIDVSWKIYANDSYWVPPLRFDLLKTLEGKDNPLFLSGEHTFFMAYEDNEPVGRLCVGINENLNKKRNLRDGYISLFECIENYSVALSLFDRASAWLKERGIDTIKGPVSPTNGDDNKGLLVEGFDGSPVLLNSYNPAYYKKFFEDYGFTKHEDLYAYKYDIARSGVADYKRPIEYAMKRYNFRIDPINMKALDKEIIDIKCVMDLAMPDWEDLTPPTLEEIKAEVENLKAMADPDLVLLARSGDKPVGFAIILPDYYQVLKHMNGRIFPFGFLKFLFYKRKIDKIRVFVLFVVPEFRKKAVSSAIFFRAFETALSKNIIYAEGSTIGETNLAMRRDAEKAGGVHYRTYRIYKKDI